MTQNSSGITFIDLNAQQSKITKKIQSRINNVLSHGQYIMGPEVAQFETELQKFTSATHAISCANGTDAISLTLMAWSIGPKDAVFVPAFTYVASAESPAQLGATPFFVDVNADTFNMDPDSLEQAIIDATKSGFRPSVVISVDLFGQPSNYPAIKKIADQAGAKVLIDGAQSFGASLEGHIVGSMGDATTTSFFPAKPLGCYGDGGAVFTNDTDLADKISSIRLHGKGKSKYDHVRIGMNSRLDTIQAAILLEKLKIFPAELVARDKIASFYSKGLSGIVEVPKLVEGAKSSWAQYTIKTSRREELKSKLSSANIPSAIYYPSILPDLPCYSEFPTVSSGLKNASKLPSQVLSLPMHPYILEEQQEIIIGLLQL